MRVYVCRRELSSANEMAARITALGHSIAGCASSRDLSAADLSQSGADVFLLDRYMPYPDGETLRKALHPQKCFLIGTDADTAIKELEAYAKKRVSFVTKQVVSETLMQLGFRLHRRGTQQIISAVCAVVQDERALSDLKHSLYPIVAVEFGTTWQSVERNLRYAIETVWTQGNLGEIQRLFGYTVEAERGKPTNKAFLAQIAEYIRRKRA